MATSGFSNFSFVPSASARGGPAWTPPSVEEVSRLLPGYEVLSLIGCGGMGAVYLALQTALDRPVAIKLLPLEVSVDEEFAQRFVREARAMARLSHPHITLVHDSGKTSAGHLYYVMEFVDGQSLKAKIAAGLKAEEALSIAAQVCDALGCAHAQGIVHRDIKPANVLLDQTGRVKVADFGIARVAAEGGGGFTLTHTGRSMGTPDYVAPEQSKGAEVDSRADLFSTGVMLCEMLCGEVPRGVFAPPSQRGKCGTRVDAIVTKAMQQSPKHRFQSAAEMQAALVAAQRNPAENVRRLPRLMTAVVAVAALAGAAWYFLKQRPAPAPASPPSPASAGAAAVPAKTAPTVRETAEWLFRVGNEFSHLGLWQPRAAVVKVTSVAELPAGDWEIVDLWMDRLSSQQKPPVTREDFQRHTAGLTQLRSFFCRNLPVHDADFSFLARNPELDSLRLEGLPLTDAVLEHLRGLKHLRILNITADANQGSTFTGRGLEQFACRPALEELLVIGTRFDDAGARGLLAFPNLRTVHLGGTAVTDACLSALRTHPALETLHLDYTAVTDAGVLTLAEMKRLKTLTVQGMQESTLTALRAALPGCKVGPQK